MLLLRLWNYIRGYVIILVEGYFLEKFVNICIKRQIYLWDVKRQKNSKMMLKISIKGFKLLRPIARKTGCSVRIIRKRGLPFIINRYRARKTFILGSIVFIALFYAMTSFVWTVEVVGNEKVETQMIIDTLEDMGIKPGVVKFRVDTQSIANSIILDIDGLSWVNVIVRGTKLKVEVAEGVERPLIIPKDEPCDLVAVKDGIIKSILVKEGHQLVKEGDTVKKGQVLISGTIPILNEDNFRIVHAMGEVLARTWYENKQEVCLKVVDNVRTGNKKDNISLVTFWRRIPLLNRKINFNNHEKVEIEKIISIGEDLVLPFGFVVERYYEYIVVEADVSIEEAKAHAAENAYEEILEFIPKEAKIVDVKVTFVNKDDDILYADVIVECIEDIGITKEIGGE
ncbi:UNVERIFIED_CONTAM: hypothetical protein Cloal_1992 [Acetivibrio alkalicellulosi]